MYRVLTHEEKRPLRKMTAFILIHYSKLGSLLVTNAYARITEITVYAMGMETNKATGT